jgi:ankyrin repeat protein
MARRGKQSDPLEELNRAKARVRDDPRSRQLVAAISKGDVAKVRKLLAAGADPDAPDPSDDGFDPPVMVATVARKPEVIRLLAKAGADLNAGFPDTPLTLAAGWGHLELTRALIEGGADVNRPDDGGQTPLGEAVGKKHLDVIAALLEAGADPNFVTKEERDRGNRSPLEYAVHDRAVLDVFLAHGVAGRHVPALMLCGAASRGDAAEVGRLLDEGVGVNSADATGDTPLTSAAAAGHAKVVELLLSRGADVNRRAGKAKFTPLVAATISGKVPVVRKIVEAGGTRSLETALECAKNGRLKKVVDYLLEVRAARPKAKQAAKPKPTRTGVPTFDVNDTCVLVEGVVEDVAAALERHIGADVWRQDVLGQRVKLTDRCFAVFRIVGQPWSIVMRLNCADVRQYLKPPDGRALSKALKTRAIVVTSGDTSGIYQYVTFQRGKAVEILDSGSAADDTDRASIARQFRDWYGVDLGDFAGFEIRKGTVFASSLRKLKLAGVKNVLTFIRDHLTRENAFVPFFGDAWGRKGDSVELTIEGLGPDDVERLDYVAARRGGA